MCVMSLVHDHYEPIIPTVNPYPYVPNPGTQTFIWPPFDVAEVRKLVAEFREAIEAAKKLDTLMKQPDCVDPKKATLIDRIAELEKRCAQLEATVGGAP